MSFRDLLPTASSKVRLIEGGVNNLPDDHSHRAAMDIYDLLQSLTEDDLVLALISGMLCNYFVSGLCSNFTDGLTLNAALYHTLVLSSVNKLSLCDQSACFHFIMSCRS